MRQGLGRVNTFIGSLCGQLFWACLRHRTKNKLRGGVRLALIAAMPRNAKHAYEPSKLGQGRRLQQYTTTYAKLLNSYYK